MFEDVFNFDDVFNGRKDAEKKEEEDEGLESNPLEQYSLFKNNTPAEEVWTTGKARDIWSTGGNDVWSTEDD